VATVASLYGKFNASNLEGLVWLDVEGKATIDPAGSSFNPPCQIIVKIGVSLVNPTSGLPSIHR
jgi:hypothetical protein